MKHRNVFLMMSLLALSQFAVTSLAEEATTLGLRPDLAVYHREVTTSSEEAQKYFDQGLILYYGFNHEAAIESFKKVAELDPKCAMAYWGQAISAGPNINNPHMDEDASKSAYEASRKAEELQKNASPVEQALIAAIVARYTWPVGEDRHAQDVAYSEGMQKAWKQYPKDADVGALYAESVMDLRPWDLWSPEGEPRPETPAVVATLESVLAMVPDHPLACHLYIHTMEASPTPEKALPQANVLRDRVPGAGHLVHMPAHIDIRLGHYDDAVVANQKAVEIDKSWASQGGFYTLYRAHNYHFLAWAAMFEGRKKLTMEAMDGLRDQIDLELVRAYPDFLDAFMGTPVHAMVRFGMWNEILALPTPPEDLQAWTAFWRYGRTISLAALGRVDEAAAELEAFKKAYEAVPESRTLGNNSARTVLEVGLPMAEGELEYRRGNNERAFELLREAVKRDTDLHYDEPWGWMMPVSHSLGAILLDCNHPKEAEQVYRADLKLHPMNGWALHGLAESLRAQGRDQEAEVVAVQFRTAWSHADVTIKSSCYCRKGS